MFRSRRPFRGLAPGSRLLALASAGLVAFAILSASTNPGVAFAASCPNADATPGQASGKVIVRATLCALNAERRSHGLRPLRVSRTLSGAARRHSRDMVLKQYFAHTTPEGSTFVKRIRRTGYLRSRRHWIVGEDLAWGPGRWGSPAGVVRAWMHSPGHRRVILTPLFREVGIGLAWGAPQPFAERAMTYTSDFGVRLLRDRR